MLLRRLCLASAPPCRFRARFAGRRSRWGVSWRSSWSFVARPLVVPRSSSGVLGPSVGLQFTLLFGCWKTSRSSSDFRGYGSGFLPPTAGRSFIGGTSAWSGPLLRVTAISLAFGLATAVFRGSGFTHGYGLSPVFLSFGSGGRRRLSTLYALCIDLKFFPVNLASSRLSLLWVFSGLVQVLSCLALSVPVGSTLRLFTGWFLLAVVVSSWKNLAWLFSWRFWLDPGSLRAWS